jgi:hypothetical protein
VGFSIAFGIFALAANRWFTRRAAEQAENAEDMLAARSPIKDIGLSTVEEVKHDGAMVIVGTATNNGKKGARGIHIQANLFNHDNQGVHRTRKQRRREHVDQTKDARPT